MFLSHLLVRDPAVHLLKPLQRGKRFFVARIAVHTVLGMVLKPNQTFFVFIFASVWFLLLVCRLFISVTQSYDVNYSEKSILKKTVKWSCNIALYFMTHFKHVLSCLTVYDKL